MGGGAFVVEFGALGVVVGFDVVGSVVGATVVLLSLLLQITLAG